MEQQELNELEAQLVAAEAKSKGARDAEARTLRAAEIRAKMLAEANAQRDLPKIAEIEGARGVDFDVVVCRLGHVAVKKPSPVVWKRFGTSKLEPRDAADQLVRSCLLYPDVGAFSAITDDQPAILDSIALTVARLAGADIERLQGKS